MIASEVVNMASSQVGYHEKIVNTPTEYLYPFRNYYDGSDNWTKYHNDIGVSQGQPWCGFFAYWCFFEILGTAALTNQFLHNIVYYGGAVSSWANAFTTTGDYFEAGTYMPKAGDLVIFSDTDVPWSHIEFVVDVSEWPTYIGTIGGNTRNPDAGGSQSEGQWVARRRRSATATTGFHVRGYCRVHYSDTPSNLGFVVVKKKRFTAFG